MAFSIRVAVAVFVLVIIARSFAQQDCSTAPTEALKIICEQLNRWDASAREAQDKPLPRVDAILPPSIPGQPKPEAVPLLAEAAAGVPIPLTAHSCMSLDCLCPYLHGSIGPDGTCFLKSGKPLKPALRKEYRRLTDDERTRFHGAMNTLKQNGEFQRIAKLHSQTGVSGGAHSGPAFLPWHREYTKRVEIAIRLLDPDLAMPYWGSVLDQNMPDSRDSVLFSSLFFGESDSFGNVINGAYANWKTLEGRASILRHTGSQASLFTDVQLNNVYSQTAIDQVLAYTAPRQGCPVRPDWNCLEYVHGNPHIWVGGDMLDQSTSANDPVFYMHHSFVDLIWENWRQKQQSRADRETVYPNDIAECSNVQHFKESDMKPFDGVKNIDGLSNKYTDNMYQYEQIPTCSAGAPNCGSDFLFCDLTHGNPRCVSKAREGGKCDGGFEQSDICYKGTCQNGRCVGKNEVTTPSTKVPDQTTTPTTTTSTTTIATTRLSTTPAFVNCFNENQCCATWATSGECTRNPVYMNSWCMASCGRCKPSFDISVECSDHHKQCKFWADEGECKNNELWMTENCRQTCNACSPTRAEVCSGKATTQPPSTTATTQRVTNVPTVKTTQPPTTLPTSCDPGCWNEFICCEEWKQQGQ
uniref:ShKT domain-containing protein n=1 Tax=Plectus sambesii TaxID=2011161 RepID=A0A914V7H0_9BILA